MTKQEELIHYAERIGLKNEDITYLVELLTEAEREARQPHAKAIALLEQWLKDANEYPSWAYQYRSRVIEALELLKQGKP